MKARQGRNPATPLRHRRHGGAPGSPARHLDPAPRRRRLRRPLAGLGIAPPKNARGEYALWQPRFWEHTIRNETDLARHVDYIHYNPVKHGHVTTVADWPYSSFHRYVRAGLHPPDWSGTARQHAAIGNE